MQDPQHRPIEAARRAAGLTQQELGEAIGVTQAAISLIESGQRRLRLDQALKLARRLGVPVESLISEDAAAGGSHE